MVDLDTKSQIRDSFFQWLRVLIMIGAVLVLWASAYYIVIQSLRLGIPADKLPVMGEFATLLFGSASLALFIFSILIGLIGLIGYQTIRKGVRKDIQTATYGRIDTLEEELRGRVLTVIGFMIGSLRSDPLKLKQGDESKGFLSEAVWYCQKGYDTLKNSKAKGQSMALNNLVYYTSLYGEGFNREQLLAQAKALKLVGQKYKSPPSLLTYCRVVLQSGSNPEDLRDAHTVATAVLRMDLTQRQRNEATFYVASLADRLSQEQEVSD
jgi:hypothetical protein